MPYISPYNIEHAGFISDHTVDPEHTQARAIWRNDQGVNLMSRACECWEVLDSGIWMRIHTDPTWGRRSTYRYTPPKEWIESAKKRAPASVLTKLANKIAASKPALNTPYWCINTCAPNLLHEGEWLNLPEQQAWFAEGLVFWDKARAKSVAETLRNYIVSQKKDG